MSTNKKFNSWIAQHFKGLSAHTLYQLLLSNTGNNSLFANVYNNLVYVDLFEYFTGNKTDRCFNAYMKCVKAVEECAWL